MTGKIAAATQSYNLARLRETELLHCIFLFGWVLLQGCDFPAEWGAPPHLES